MATGGGSKPQVTFVTGNAKKLEVRTLFWCVKEGKVASHIRPPVKYTSSVAACDDSRAGAWLVLCGVGWFT